MSGPNRSTVRAKARLEELAAKVNKLLDSKSPISFVRSGGYLSEAKELTPGRGAFERWRRTTFLKDLSRKSARSRMNAFEYFGEVDPDLLQRFHTSAMTELAQKGSEAVSEAVTLAKRLPSSTRINKRQAMQIAAKHAVTDDRDVPLARRIVSSLRETYGKELSLDRVHQLLEDACCAYETIEAVASALGKRISPAPHEAMQRVYGQFELSDEDEWTIRKS